MASASKVASGPMTTCTFSRSTSSWVFAFACAGCPAVSAKKICTLRPASSPPRSFSSRLMPCSICAPPAASGPVRIVLFVHGATFPSEAGFDLDLPGGSWMDYAASRGFDAYLVDVRGYGRSTRPAVMEQPPLDNPPFADHRDAVRDISAAVDF